MKSCRNRKAARIAITIWRRRILGAALRRNLKHALETPIDDLLKTRYAKFRKLGNFAEAKAKSVA